MDQSLIVYAKMILFLLCLLGMSLYSNHQLLPMRHSLIVCAALFMSGFSASAIPAMDHLEIQLEGEAEGWLNATCTYYEIGWISQANAKVALERILLQAGHFLDREEVQRAQNAALTRDPDCQSLWPVLSD